MDTKQQQGIEIELKEDVAQGTYTNLAIISHSPSEFIIDFVRMVPGVPKAQVKTRVILTPDRAKALLYALQDNIAKYEANIRKIPSPPRNEPQIPLDFGGNNPTA